MKHEDYCLLIASTIFCLLTAMFSWSQRRGLSDEQKELLRAVRYNDGSKLERIYPVFFLMLLIITSFFILDSSTTDISRMVVWCFYILSMGFYEAGKRKEKLNLLTDKIPSKVIKIEQFIDLFSLYIIAGMIAVWFLKFN